MKRSPVVEAAVVNRLGGWLGVQLDYANQRIAELEDRLRLAEDTLRHELEENARLREELEREK